MHSFLEKIIQSTQSVLVFSKFIDFITYVHVVCIQEHGKIYEYKNQNNTFATHGLCIKHNC
jgi:hypothetical protein